MELEENLLTTDEFARAMRTSRRNIRLWIARGVIRPDEYIQPTRRILIRREALSRLTTSEKTSAPVRRRPKADTKKQTDYDLMNLQKTLAKVGGKMKGEKS